VTASKETPTVGTLPPLRTGRPRSERGHLSPLPGFTIPFAVVEGRAPGPCLLVTAGVHGSEYTSIEAALRLMRMPPGDFAGTLLVLPILNVGGFHARSVYVMPEDGRNLNRAFPGRADGTASERLAHWLVTTVFPEADAYLDLHGGDLSEELAPFSLFPAADRKARALAEAFGLPVAVAAGGAGYTIDAAARAGLPGIIAEVGGNGLWSEAGVGAMTAGIRRCMAHLGMLLDPQPAASQPTRVVTMWVPTAPVTGLWYPARAVADPVQSGDVLGSIRDVFGETRATIVSDRAGSVLYRLSSLHVEAGEALLGVGTPEADAP
jgi:uncharacterized protein